MNITLDRLRYFLEVAKLEHVGLAGKSLGVSTSAISSAISALEDEYQCTLFERLNKRIHLNERGRVLREQVEPILESVENLTHLVNTKQSKFNGYLSIGGSFF
jgi:DNA-binding transcriptional LysR family regulator